MRAFIIRPFGEKEGVDFDLVEERLIGPALDAQPERIQGRTTGDIISAGNIRTDMFEQILQADLVVADISIHNANVFYELGIRHALRDRKTILIRSRVAGHEVPFDLKTDRYLEYDHDEPEKARERLTDVIRQTIASDSTDSPVFQLLPSLVPVDTKRLVVLPRSFSEEVDLAGANRDTGRLRLLAEEARGLSWEVGGLRRVGGAQFGLRDWEGAEESLEAVIALFPDDVEANTLLGTVYQRRGDLALSSQAIDRVLDSEGLAAHKRAEARALQARNQKTEWEAEWRDVEDMGTRQLAALRSGHLETSMKIYDAAFAEDRNHFYSGLNALAMAQITLRLTQAHPSVWEERFEDEEEAESALRKLDKRSVELAAAVRLSIASGIERLEREDSDEEVWARISRADLIFLTSSKPKRVAQAYREALAGAPEFAGSAARNQIDLYDQLDLFGENTKEVLELLPEHDVAAQRARVVVFTGHRVDARERETPRFPSDKESLAREWIQEAVAAEKLAAGDSPIVGIAGGASGGDILFHEVCADLDIATQMFLAIPADSYIAASVADGGPEWVRRFNDLQTTTDPEVLADSDDVPKWLRTTKGYGIWQRSNLWMLHTAFARGERVSLIALWNGQHGDGPGGTEDMVERAKQRGARAVILDASRLLE